MHIRKNDIVKVVRGKEKGKTGKVIEVDYKHDMVRVENLNVQKRHTKSGRSQKNPYGGIIDKPGPIHVSNLMLLCGGCGKAVRPTYKIQAEGGKVRYCRKCGEMIAAKRG